MTDTKEREAFEKWWEGTSLRTIRYDLARDAWQAAYSAGLAARGPQLYVDHETGSTWSTKPGLSAEYDELNVQRCHEIQDLKRALASAAERERELREFIGRVAKHHAGCEDGWYACPLSEDYIDGGRNLTHCQCWKAEAERVLGEKR